MKERKMCIKISTPRLLKAFRRRKQKAHTRKQAATTFNVDLKYTFECDCRIELSDSKLVNNKLSSNKLPDDNLGDFPFKNDGGACRTF